MGPLSNDVLDLAHQHDVRVWVCLNCEDGGTEATGDATGDPFRYIRVNRPITTPEAYLIALHELGHFAGTHSWNDLKLDQEASAWLWALDQSMLTMTPKDWQVVLDSLESYTHDRRLKHTPLFLDLLEDVRARV